MFDKFKSVMKTLGLRGEDPVATRHDLVDFIDGRAAYIASHPLHLCKSTCWHPISKLFENADFLTSLRIARWHIYGAAVCDLTLFSAAQLYVHAGLSAENARDFAADILDDILPNYLQDDIDGSQFSKCAHAVNNAPRWLTGARCNWPRCVSVKPDACSAGRRLPMN